MKTNSKKERDKERSKKKERMKERKKERKNERKKEKKKERKKERKTASIQTQSIMKREPKSNIDTKSSAQTYSNDKTPTPIERPFYESNFRTTLILLISEINHSFLFSTLTRKKK